jgi:hypothetical protein
VNTLKRRVNTSPLQPRRHGVIIIQSVKQALLDH